MRVLAIIRVETLWHIYRLFFAYFKKMDLFFSTFNASIEMNIEVFTLMFFVPKLASIGLYTFILHGVMTRRKT